MAQKKNETVPAANDNMDLSVEETSVGGLFVDTFWNQYEQSRARARQLRESREDAYIKALREVIKFNKQYRNSLAKFYEQSKKANKEIVTGLMNQITFGRDEMNDGAVKTSERDELKNQLNEVSNQLEKLAFTPIKSVVHMIDQLEDNFEKNAESGVEYTRERRDAWQQVKDEYVKLAKDTHYNMVDRGMNSFKELVKAR